MTDGPYQTIGVNKVTIPKYYYKVVLDYLEPGLKAIGFILPNKKGSYPLSQYAVTVNEVEIITDINFFYILSDDVEEMLESKLDLSLWSFNGYKTSGSNIDVNKDHSGDTKYWINTNSDTRHNSKCRYYGKTKEGYYSNQKIGKPGKICGG